MQGNSEKELNVVVVIVFESVSCFAVPFCFEQTYVCRDLPFSISFFVLPVVGAISPGRSDKVHRERVWLLTSELICLLVPRKEVSSHTLMQI